ncbi:hypothetical protein J3459_006408 [Metarhizium acridum]|nr:hypothetical protein J3459_006408 [Metarhizium acridum]
MHSFPTPADGAGAASILHQPLSVGPSTSSFDNASTQLLRTPPQQHIAHTPPQGISAQPLGISQQQQQQQPPPPTTTTTITTAKECKATKASQVLYRMSKT